MKQDADREKLSKRELEVAERYAGGANYRDIAAALGIAPATVRTHLGTIYRKLGVSSKIALLRALNFAIDVAPDLVMPDVPSLAVLPFKATGSDPELRIFADGLAEELSAVLARVPDMFVTASSSSAIAAEVNGSVTEIGNALGVAYVLVGNVQSSRDRLRVNATLQECQTGRTVWAERYETSLTDTFDVQDDISRNIAVSLQVKLTYGEMSRLWEGQTRNLRAWERMAEGRRLFNRFSATDMMRARAAFEDALNIDPGYSGALLHLGLTHWWDARYRLERPVDEALAEVHSIATCLREASPDESGASYLEGYSAFVRGEHELAIAKMERAANLSPSDSWKIACLGQVRIFAGQDREGISDLRRAMRLSPFYPDWYPYNLIIGLAWLGAERDTVLSISRAYVGRVKTDPYGWMTAATVAHLCDEDGLADSMVQSLKDRFPDFRVANALRSERYADGERLETVIGILERNDVPR